VDNNFKFAHNLKSSMIIKYVFHIFIIILFLGCKNDIELSMERGIQFYEWDMLEKAILEFKYVIHTLESENKQNYNNIELLSRAHHNLAVSYAKKSWYTDALEEAIKAFKLLPTDENRKVLELIRTKASKNKDKL